MEIFPFRGLYPKAELIASYDPFINAVKYNFQEYCQNGFYSKDETPCHYIYQITNEVGSYTGVLSTIHAQQLNGNILKHEDTIAFKEQTTIDLILHRLAMIKPILLTHPSNGSLDLFLNRFTSRNPSFIVNIPEYREEHRFWRVDDRKEGSHLAKIFREQINEIYVADGHHRTAAFMRIRSSKNVKKLNLDMDFLYSAFFSFDNLEILDYNRIIDALTEYTPISFMAAISNIFNIERIPGPAKPEAEHELTMYLRREWFRLTWRSKILKKYSTDDTTLDSHLFNEELLISILSFSDVRNDPRIRYVPGREGLSGLIMKTNMQDESVGFCIYRLSKEKLRQVVQSGRVLPPKTTWFEPRLRNGLLAHEFSQE